MKLKSSSKKIAAFSKFPLSISTILILYGLLEVALTLAGSNKWPQWGGPDRNFRSKSKGLASSWPTSGPHIVWSRKLGEGYSGIVGDSNTLYTMYRKSTEEIVISLNARTGTTLWEQGYSAPFIEKQMGMENGAGPHSTPLLVGRRLYTVGVTGKLHCLDAQSGRILWRHDLIQEFGATVLFRGYSCHPIAYQNSVIVTAGGANRAVMAFSQQNGALLWKKQDFKNSHSSPILINLDGQDQLVVFVDKEIAGLDPKNGELIWSYTHGAFGDNIASTPVWAQGNLLFCSSAYDNGSRVLKLTRTNGKTNATELWFTNKLRVHHGNVVNVGSDIYGSSGSFGPALFTAMDLRSGTILWQNRDFPKATCLYADGKLIILAEDGSLALAVPTPEGLQILSRIELLKRNAWTPPSLIGSRLHLRDRSTIMTLDLR